MEVIDKSKNTLDVWELGDVITDGVNIALIVQNNDKDYCVMDITPFNKDIYKANLIGCFGRPEPTLKVLYQAFSSTWHKVNAKLVIE